MPADRQAESAEPSKKEGFDRIFLSYARGDDEAFASRLYDDLTRAGFDVWFDRVSMPSRSLTFHQEIRDAIAARERLILIVGPKAITSDYVTQEWQFAYYAANKCVNPIVRLDGRDSQGNKVDGYALIPEDLKLLHAEDFRRDAEYDVHLKNLIRQLSESLPPVGKLVAVPELPPGYRAQPERLRALRDLLLLDLQKPVVVTGAAARVGLQGMGGIGKSVLANALAHHPQVQRAFQDGIYWVTLGQQPRLEELQRQLAVALGGAGQFNNRHEGKEHLRKLLADRAVLLILDDVWERDHADAFNVVSARSRILLTTRDAGLVTALAARENHYRVELPTVAEGQAILGGAADVPPDQLPPEADAIIKECGRLPLALALCGGMVHGGSSWSNVLVALQEHDLEFLSNEHADEGQHQNAWKAMDISLRVLPADEQQRFAELAVFGADTGAPDAAVATLWQHTAGLNQRQTEALLAKFIRRSLVQRPFTADGKVVARVDLHDLLHHFAIGMAIKQFGSAKELHQRLLDAYRAKCPDGWPSGPDDGYFLQNVCQHLATAAGKWDEAVELLCDLKFVAARSRVGEVFELVADYRLARENLPEAQADLRKERLHEERLQRWTVQIIEYAKAWSQRRDRIARRETVTEPEPKIPEPVPSSEVWAEDRIQAECDRIIHAPTRRDKLEAFAGFVEAECYHLLEFGKRDGFVVQNAFNQMPSGPIHDAADQLVNRSQIPMLLRRWETNAICNPKPALLRILKGHTGPVNCVCVTPDGRRAISGSGNLSPDGDNTLRVWDLESGACLRILKGHTSQVNCVSVTPDGRRAISGSGAHDDDGDTTLRVWDLESGACLRILKGHTSRVNCVSMTPDGRRAISGSGDFGRHEDNSLRVWDLESGACLCILTGHSTVESVRITFDGSRAVSGSYDGNLRMWDLETEMCLQILSGHRRELLGVDVTPDGRRGVSIGGALTLHGSIDNVLQAWALDTGQCLLMVDLGCRENSCEMFSDVTITPDARRAITSTSDNGGSRNTLQVWDLPSGKCVRTLVGHSDTIDCLSVTPDGRTAVSGSSDLTVRVWALENMTSRIDVLAHTRRVHAIAIAPTARRAVSAGDDHKLCVWDLKDRKCVRTLLGHSHSVGDVSVTPDGRLAVSGSHDGTMRVWDLKSGACLSILHHPDSVDYVATTQDGRCAMSSSRGTLRVWDLERGECLRTINEGSKNYMQEISMTQDGRRAVSVGDGKLHLWEVNTGSCLCTVQANGNSRFISQVVTPDLHRAVFGYEDGNLDVWDLRSVRLLRKFPRHSDEVNCVSVTPDGRFVASASEDNALRVWNVDSGQCMRTLATPSARILIMRMTTNGRRAVTWCEDHTMRWWSLEDGQCQSVMPLFGGVSSLALVDNENMFCIGTSDGAILFVEWHDVQPSLVSKCEMI